MRKSTAGNSTHAESDRKLQEVLNRLSASETKLVASDVETSGLDWRHNHIVGYVVTFSPKPQDSFYIPVRHKDGGNIGGQKGPQTSTGWDGKTSKGEQLLLKAMDRPGLTRFGHNMSFDLKFESRCGVKLECDRYEDTILNEPLLNEFAKFSLEQCALRHGVQGKKSADMVAYLRRMFPEIKSDREAMGHYWRLSGADRMAIEYAEGDGTTTWQLRDKQMVEIGREEEWRGSTIPSLERVWDVESRLLPILTRMSLTGIKIDEEYLHGTIAGVSHRIDEGMEKFQKACGRTDISIWTANDLIPYLEANGATDWPLTPKTRKPSIKEEWLKTHPAGKAIITMRQLTMLRDSFLIPMRDTHLWNGRVHTNFNQLRNDDFGTVTGRLSSNDPNLQQIHKHNVELGKLLRTAFLSDYGKWGSVDYSQIEPRLLAYYARCKVLLNAYKTDPRADAHTEVTRAMAGPRWDTMTKDERKAMRNERGKRVNQTLVTGGGKGVIVAKYGVAPEEVDKLWNDYFRAMPEIKVLQKQASDVMKRRGYVVSLLGRKARLRDPDKSYVAVNRLLQCGNADILKLKMVEVGEYLRKEAPGEPIDLLINCHDAIDFQFDESTRHHYERCTDIMTDFGPDSAMPLDLPIVLDKGEGSNWAEATYGEDE